MDERIIRNLVGNPGYRRWDVCKALSGTVETSSCRCVTYSVNRGIRRPPKAVMTQERGVGGGHSTCDGGDNKTPPEGRASASVTFSMKEALRDCES